MTEDFFRLAAGASLGSTIFLGLGVGAGAAGAGFAAGLGFASDVPSLGVAPEGGI